MLLLAGDIGGTKTNLSVFSSEAGFRSPLVEATFRSAQYPDLETLTSDFLSHVDLKLDRASFGVAGPVIDGQSRITNLPWAMDETALRDALNLESVTLLNDLDAIANAVPWLISDDLYVLKEGQEISGGAKAVIAPGTGLGESFLTWDGERYRPHPSEGGHADFAPVDSLQMGLLRFLMGRLDHVSFEQVCSGKGIPNIYAYLKESGGYGQEPEWLTEQLAAASDPTPVIVSAALEDSRSCELCTATLDTFVAILAAEAGNLALKVLAAGGVYLGGGIPPRILARLTPDRFVPAFTTKGRLSDPLIQVPVYVILNPKVPLLGAACHGLGM